MGTGYLLDKNYSYRKTIKFACLISITSDLILFYSQNYLAYIFGQFLLGAAAGIYWPSVELAIPSNCNNRIKSDESYALARTADAIGVTLGVIIGTIWTYIDLSRVIYLIDIICMIYIFYILINKLSRSNNIEESKNQIRQEKTNKTQSKIYKNSWIFDLSPLFLITLFVTGVMSLLQIILPLDLANGGITRPPLIEEHLLH